LEDNNKFETAFKEFMYIDIYGILFWMPGAYNYAYRKYDPQTNSIMRYGHLVLSIKKNRLRIVLPIMWENNRIQNHYSDYIDWGLDYFVPSSSTD